MEHERDMMAILAEEINSMNKNISIYIYIYSKKLTHLSELPLHHCCVEDNGLCSYMCFAIA